MKIVINKQYGGFGLSAKAVKEYSKLKGKEVFVYEMKFKGQNLYYEKVEDNENGLFLDYFTKDLGKIINSKDLNDEIYEKYGFRDKDICRTDEELIKVVEKLGEEANTSCSSLKIIEIPDDIDWIIEEYDGMEWVAERHRTWC